MSIKAYMYMGSDYAQDPSVHYGKLLRLDSDGAPAADNPFLESGNFFRSVFCRASQSTYMDFHPQTGELWAWKRSQGGDEVNRGLRQLRLARVSQSIAATVSDRQWQSDIVQPEILVAVNCAGGFGFHTGQSRAMAG